MKNNNASHSHPLLSPLLNGDRQALSRSISLLESQLDSHRLEANILMENILSHTGKSIRVAISGVPGVGKSSFVEALGLLLTGMGKKVGVLTIDPSSKQSGGSILGDKTRMTQLSSTELAYIRTTPAASSLGGVAQNTRGSIKLCEAAGFEVILIETVGVGQNELEVHEMVDFFLLLNLPGAGDEIQGIKRGIMEVADALLINKADGDAVPLAKKAQQYFKAALHAFQSRENGWSPPVLLASATEGTGIVEIWQQIETFVALQQKSGDFERNRQQQEISGWKSQLTESLKRAFFKDPTVKALLLQLELEITRGDATAVQATQRAIDTFRKA
jgi:LAO/AO transport system kinase